MPLPVKFDIIPLWQFRYVLDANKNIIFSGGTIWIIDPTASDNIIKNVEFVGGCSGNTQGVSRLVQGMDVHEAISRLEGITCGNKPTSCPDQLAWALKQAISQV